MDPLVSAIILSVAKKAGERLTSDGYDWIKEGGLKKGIGWLTPWWNGSRRMKRLNREDAFQLWFRKEGAAEVRRTMQDFIVSDRYCILTGIPNLHIMPVELLLKTTEMFTLQKVADKARLSAWEKITFAAGAAEAVESQLDAASPANPILIGDGSKRKLEVIGCEDWIEPGVRDALIVGELGFFTMPQDRQQRQATERRWADLCEQAKTFCGGWTKDMVKQRRATIDEDIGIANKAVRTLRAEVQAAR